VIRFLLFLFTSAVSAENFKLPPAPVAEPILYEADYFEYQGSTTGANAQILLRGNVEIRESSRTMRAEETRLDMSQRKAEASGGFELDDGLSVLRGDSGTFDLESHEGSVSDVHAEFQPWRIWARRGALDPSRKTHFRRTLFTSCNGNPPHYHFKSGGLHVKPGKWLYATNVVFFVGKVPLFYSPFMWKSLDAHRPIKTKMTFGLDRRSGGSARSTTEIPVHPSVFSRLFLDYYTETGAAQGAEVQFKSDEDARGAFYGYRIHENATSGERWTVLGNYYQKIVSSYSVQGRLQAQSDPDVNNHYVRSNAFRVTPELVNSGALVRQTSLTTTRISYSRLDVRRGLTDRFIRSQESTPRIDWQTAPLPVPKMPGLLTANAFADNSFDAGRGYQQKAAGVGTRWKRSQRLWPGASITPEAAFREVFEDKRTAFGNGGSTRTVSDALTGFYEVGGNLRVDTPVGSWDTGYFFERRLKSNHFQGDVGAPDYGVEKSLLTLGDTIRPNRRVLLRVFSGYDFKRHRESNASFRRRVQPFTSDLVYLPGRGVQLSLRSYYQLEEGNRALLLQADWGDRDATFAAFGTNYTVDRPDEYISAFEAGWAPEGSSWKFGGALRSQIWKNSGIKLRGYKLFEKELSVHKDFHDFLARLQVRFRPGNVQEVMLRVDLKTDREAIRRTARKMWEKEWFPWRRDSDDR